MTYEVVRGAVAPALAGATHHGVLWQARRGAYLLDVPEVARYPDFGYEASHTMRGAASITPAM